MENSNSIVVLGASPNPQRTSYLAAKLLVQKGYDVKAYGQKGGTINNLSILKEIPKYATQKIKTISIFLKPEKQQDYYEYILSAEPKSIIFNPGTENPELIKLARRNKISIIECCTIALFAVGAL